MLLRLAVLAVLLLVGCASSPPVFYDDGQVQQPGCSFQTGMGSGGRTARYTSLVIVGEREGLDEDGNPVQEYLVLYPDRPYLHPVRDGKLVPVNVPKSKILKAGEVRIGNGVLLRCPWW